MGIMDEIAELKSCNDELLRVVLKNVCCIERFLGTCPIISDCIGPTQINAVLEEIKTRLNQKISTTRTR